jgi:excisionase family DNA binding protein
MGRTEARMIVLDGEEYLTVEEAAGLLEIKPATLYAYVSRGVLKSYRQGIKRQRLYRRADVEALLRVAPSSGSEPAEGDLGVRRIPEIPLAESWIRE